MTGTHPLIVEINTTFENYISAYDNYTSALDQLEAHQKYNAALQAAVLTWETEVENACLAFQNAVNAAMAAGLVPAAVGASWGSGNFSIDEFRYWKKARTHKEVRRNWFSQVGGGSNETDVTVRDKANSDLGVYYKFNEGILDDKCVSKGDYNCQDSNVIDYSGRASNGTIVNYNEEVRSTGSAFDESGLITSPEPLDPILYPNHPDIVTLLQDKKMTGRAWDLQNNASIYNSVPHWMTESDEDGNLLQLTQIISSYFDQLHMQVQELPRLKDMVYDDPEMQEIPYPFSKDLLLSMGFTTPDIFVDATVLEEIASRDEERVFEKDIQVIKNLIYQNIYNNLVYIYKTKGTEKSFENLIRCFGVDDELIKLNLYADNVVHKLEDNRKFTSVKKNYVDFFRKQNNESTVYQIDDEENENSQMYIQGCPSGTDYKFVPTTFQMEVLLPKLVAPNHPDYIKPDFGYPQASMQHSSVAGFYPVNDVGQILSGGLELFTQRRSVNSSDSKFLLKADFIGETLSTDYFKENYNNEKWNLAVRVRPEDKYWQNGDTLVDLAAAATDAKYVLEFYGVNTTLDVVEQEFLLTSSPFSFTTFQNYMEANKRIYLGARRSGFDSTNVLNKSDVRITDVRYWFDYLDNETIRLHAYDAKSFGRKRPYQPAYFSQSSFIGSSGGVHVPQIKTLALYWDFSTVEKSDEGVANNPITNDATFFAPDLSSGSIENSSRWGWIGDIIERSYPAQGDYFEPNDTQVVDREYAYSAKTKLPETLNSSDMIEITQRDDDIFVKGARPVTHFWAIEKSMYQTISEEMINLFASIQDFNNLVGEPVHRYRMEYKDLGKLRELFFNKIGNTPDLDKYIDFYKWLDSSMNEMLQQLIPASANFSSSMRTIVESHVLERNKYWTKFPTLEMKDSPIEANIRGIRELTYDWKTGHHSSSEDDNCDWWSERANRDLATSGDPELDEAREQIRKSIVRDIKGQTDLIEVGGVRIESGKRLLNNSTKTLYEGSTYATRRLSKPYKYSATITEPVSGGPNAPSKKRQVEFIRSVVPFGSDNGLEIGDQLQAPACTDDIELKQKIITDSSVGLLSEPEGSYLNKMWGSLGSFYSEYTSPQGPVVITNRHSDSYGEDKEVPIQGPFTQAHVGGSQHRHVEVNFSATDEQLTRPELYLYDISKSAYVSPDSIDVNNPRAGFFREETAKRPVNIKNVSSWKNLDKNNILESEANSVLGNYRLGYEVIQTSGRGLQNRYLVKNQGIRLLLDDHSAGDHTVEDLFDFRLPDRSKVHRWGTENQFTDEWSGEELPLQSKPFGSTQHVIVERFSAPGSPDTNARGAMDVETEEFSPYNSLNYRNFLVRWHLNHWHHDHMRAFGGFRHLYIHNGFDPCCGTPPEDCEDEGKVPGSNFGFVDGKYQKVAGDFCVASWHKVNRNPRHRFLEDTLEQGTYLCETVYDNWFVQHQIPQSDWQYSWINSNTSDRDCSLHGYINDYANLSNSTKKALMDPETGEQAIDDSGRPIYLDTHTYEEFTREPENTLYVSNYAGVGSSFHEPNTALNVDYERGNGLMFDVDEKENFIGRGNYDSAAGSFDLNSVLNNRGGGYMSSGWKSIRGADSIISRKHRQNNIISVRNPLSATAATDSLLFSKPATTDNTTCSRYREPAVGWNMPMRTAINPAFSVRGIRLKHTYSNNIEGFANPYLTNRMGYVKCKDQMYDLLLEQYRDSEVEPSPDFVALDYREYIFPKHRYVGLKETRERLHYFETETEKLLYRAGDLRTFWKDNKFDRKRYFTSRGALGHYSYMSVNQHNVFKQYDSVWGMDDWTFVPAENLFTEDGTDNRWSVIGELAYVGEERYHAWISSHADSYYLGHLDTFPAGAKELKKQEVVISQAESYSQKAQQQKAVYSSAEPYEKSATGTTGYKEPAKSKVETVSLVQMVQQANADSLQTQLSPAEIDWNKVLDGGMIGAIQDAWETYTPIIPNYKLPTEKPRPQMQFFYQPYSAELKFKEEGWTWNTGLLSGLSPWYNDYKQYSFSDIRHQGQNYGLVPEYRVSEHMEFYVNENGGNFRARNKSFLTLEGASFDKVSYLNSGDAKRQEERIYTHDTGISVISEADPAYYPFNFGTDFNTVADAYLPIHLGTIRLNGRLEEFLKEKYVGENFAVRKGSTDNRPVYFVDIQNSVVASQLQTPWMTDVTGSSEGDVLEYPTSFPDAVLGLNLTQDYLDGKNNDANVLRSAFNESSYNSDRATETVEVPINNTKITNIDKFAPNRRKKLYIGDPEASTLDVKDYATPFAVSFWFNSQLNRDEEYGLISIGSGQEEKTLQEGSVSITLNSIEQKDTYSITHGFQMGLAVRRIGDECSLVYYDNVLHDDSSDNIYNYYGLAGGQFRPPERVAGQTVLKNTALENSHNIWSVRSRGTQGEGFSPLRNTWNHIVLQYIPPTHETYAYVRVFVNGVVQEMRHFNFLGTQNASCWAVLGGHVKDDPTKETTDYQAMGVAHNGKAGVVRQMTLGSGTLSTFDANSDERTLSFHGYMSDAALFTGVLTQDDVRKLYNVDLLGMNGLPNNVIDTVNSSSFGKLGSIEDWELDFRMDKTVPSGTPPIKLPFSSAASDNNHFSMAQGKNGDIITDGILRSEDDALIRNLWLDGSLFGVIGWYRMGVPYVFERTGSSNNWNEDFFKVYSHTDFIKSFDLVIDDHEDLLEDTPPKLSLRANVIKKLLPYNGFYPMTRTIQLGGLFVDCWGDKVTGSCGLHHEQVVQALIQPFFAPGILFNSVKSGIAVDWAAFNNASGEEICKAEPLATATIRLNNSTNVLPDARVQEPPSFYTQSSVELPESHSTMLAQGDSITINRRKLGLKLEEGQEYIENWAEYWGDGWIEGMGTVYYPHGLIINPDMGVLGLDEPPVEFQFHTNASKKMKVNAAIGNHQPWYPYNPSAEEYDFSASKSYSGLPAIKSSPALPLSGVVNGMSNHQDWLKFYKAHNNSLLPIDKNVRGSDYNTIRMGYLKSDYGGVANSLTKHWLPFPVLGGGHDLKTYSSRTTAQIQKDIPTYYKDGIAFHTWTGSNQRPFALVYEIGDNPDAVSEPWNHIRFIDLNGATDDLKEGTQFGQQYVLERVIDTKEDVPGFWVNVGSKKIYALVQDSTSKDFVVEEVFNPFFDFDVVVNTAEDFDVTREVEGGWRWSVRPNLYELIENPSKNYYREGYYDSTSGAFSGTNNSESVTKRIVFVDIEDSFGNLLSEHEIMRNLASTINSMQLNSRFGVLAQAEREANGSSVCYLTNLNQDQANDPEPILMVDNRPETSRGNRDPVSHIEDYEYPVEEAFVVNGFIRGERYTPSFYEWDSQPKNPSSSRFPLAVFGTDLFTGQVESNDPVSSEHGMIITREPDLRIPFEGILHPESVFPPSGSMEATQEMIAEERTVRNSEARILFKHLYALNGTVITLTDPYGNEEEIIIGHKDIDNSKAYSKPVYGGDYEDYYLINKNSDKVPAPQEGDQANLFFNFSRTAYTNRGSRLLTPTVLNVMKYHINNNISSFDETGAKTNTKMWEAHILSGIANDSHPDFWLNEGCWWETYSQGKSNSLYPDEECLPVTTRRLPPGYYLRIVYKGDRSDECQVKVHSENDVFVYQFSTSDDVFQSGRTGISLMTESGRRRNDRLVDGRWAIEDPESTYLFGGTEIISDAVAQSTIYEKPSQIYFLAPEYYTGSLDEFKDWARYPYFEWTGEAVTPLYSMAMHNFLAEIPNFFLKDSQFTTFASKPESEFKEMEAGKTYYMDVVLQQSQGNDADARDGFSMTLSPNNGLQCGSVRFLSDALTTNGRYFGPSFRYKDISEYSGADLIADPAQAPYTPPYFYGRATARLSFKCEETRRYTVEEILNGVKVINLNRDARNLFLDSGGTLQSPAFSSMMTISSSVNLFGKTRDRVVTHDLTNRINEEANFLPVQARTPENSNYDRWVISPKFETPVLNFKDADHYNILECSGGTKSKRAVPDLTGGRGTGMWAGYGKLPSVDEGIFLSLEESFKQRKDWRTPAFEASGSLADVCGFQTQQSRIGDLADEKEISEALVMIPFLDQPSSRGAKTVSIGDRNFFKISKKLFNLTKQNISLGDTAPAIKPGEYNSANGVQETSISKMIKLMSKYNIPPQFDFVTYPPKSGEFPFVMYIHEFHHMLDKDDLSNIWQGVMPKIARISEKDSSIITHDLGPVDFFEGKKMPQGIRWMVFKVKRKAETNYWKKTADSSDDDRFRFNFSVGKKAPEYSYNWPYDFFSLVELVQIEGGTRILAKDVHKTTEKPLIRMEDDRVEETVASSQKAVTSSKNIIKGIFGWGKK